MSLADLAIIASIVSSLAVAASLVYLGLQTHQNIKHTRALIEQARINRIIAQYLAMADESVVAAHIAGNGGAVTPEEIKRRQFWLECSAQRFSWQDAFFQKTQGLISDETFAASRAFFVERLKQEPGLCAYFQQHSSSGIPTKFETFVKTLLADALSPITPSAPG